MLSTLHFFLGGGANMPLNAHKPELQLLNLQHFPGSSNWHLKNIRYHVHSDYGMESYMLFEADSTSAFSLETDSGTLDMHLWRTEKGKLPLISPC